MERGSQDKLNATILQNLELLQGGSMIIAHRTGLDLLEAGWTESVLRLRDARELEILIMVSMADWLQQAEDVNTNGFGGSDRMRQSYWMDGRTPGHWLWIENGIASFRRTGYNSMLDLLDRMQCAHAKSVRTSFSLVYERLGHEGHKSAWVPDMGPDNEVAKL